jgi:alkyl hydroperoxide reductase subunit AhpC
MTLRLGDEAPNFTAETTDGEVNLHDYLGDSWGLLFSHPADFTPVCTTELGELANRKGEFDQRNVKLIGLSVDPIESHRGWAPDIADVKGTALNYPLIADPERKVAELYDMIHPGSTRRSPSGRSSSSARTRRSSSSSPTRRRRAATSTS